MHRDHLERFRSSFGRGVLAAGVLVSCAPTPQSGPSGVTYFGAEDHLVRASLALRGVRPSLEDLREVRTDPAVLPTLVDVYLDSPEFGLAMMDLHAELLLVRTDLQDPLPAIGALAGATEGEIYRARAETPLELIRHIVTSDLPYTDIVTADYTFFDAAGSMMFGVPYDSSGPEWQQGWWTDGRPAAGILVDSAVWMRHTSAGNNYQRSRANLLARALLCEDFATRDIVSALGDDQFATDSLSTNPSCTPCHTSLDPLAGYFWGFNKSLPGRIVELAYSLHGCEGEAADFCYPVTFYHSRNEDLWEDLGMPAPSYYGVPAEDLTELASLVAADPRFTQCAARNFFSWLTQTEPDAIPHSLVAELQDSFVASGYSAKELARDVVLSDEFRAMGWSGEGEPPHLVAGLQSIRPEQYTRVLETLTGWRYLVVPNATWGVEDLGPTDRYGYRWMQGGIDGMYMTRPTHTASPTKVLVMETFASEAAGFVVPADFALPAAERRLLRRIEPGDTADDHVRVQLAELHELILSEPLDLHAEEIDLSLLLWQGALARSGSTEEAWKLVLTALFQDVRMFFY